ncbi:MAG TPA: hydroxyphenylacetyl-CoA thioesterase PaaI [Gaiellaceae bacterium]|nr:hydroxyphenylacetyl-CoA thioesterase PaaI [Gaiellaceae bacterium]
MSSVQEMWAGDSASRRLGIELDEVGEGRARVRMTVADWMLNGHGMCHGGLVFTLADTAFSLACNSGQDAAVAAACDVVFVAPAREGDVLVAEAAERTRFGRSGVYDVSVRREDGTPIAEFRGLSRVIARD